MYDILHRIGTTASPEDVSTALTATDQLAAWWTQGTEGDGDAGGVVQFRFGDAGGFDMKVLDVQPGRLVLWEVVDGPEEWIGTQVRFDIQRDDEWTIILFRHEGWREQVEFMNHCSTKWATFLMSLKSLVETGKGEPFPDEVRVSNWR
jgi:uncharacterized protein YndB with AHSA1/START domain